MPAMTKHAAGTVSWVDLMAWDLEKAQAFYGALFGWTFEVGVEGNGYYTMARRRAAARGGADAALQGRAVPADLEPYFAVESVDRSVARLKELGGR